MAAISSLSLPGLTNTSPNPTHQNTRSPDNPSPHFSIKLGAGCSPAGDFLRQLSVSSVLLMGLGLSSVSGFCHPASARISPASPSSSTHLQETLDAENVGNFENLESVEDENMKLAFDRWKSKSYALTVSLRIVALEGSVPPVWIREFLRSQGKRVRFRPEFRRSVGDIFNELSNPFTKGKINPKSAAAADLVSLGDSWLNFAIGKGLIEPLEGAEEQDWFQDLSDRWKVYLRRSTEGNLDSQGKIWAVPYRWGSMVIAYNRKEFQKHKLAPVEDWSDLWRPELAGKISMVDSPREIVGAVLKYMGASYNTTNIDSEVVGGRNAVLKQLDLLVQQAIPATSRLTTDQIGGRVRGSSPLGEQWVEFCLQPERALPFNEEIIPGASPISLKPSAEQPREHSKGRPKLETNLIANIPPAEIMSRCELLEPLSEDALLDYTWLIRSLKKPEQGIMNRLRLSLSSLVPPFWSKMQSEAA